MSSVVVFSGPTLRPEDRAQFSEFTHQPPVIQGDVLRLVREPPRACLIIDGYFGDRMSVLHKEILEVLSCGTEVFGAASMGALRAAELSDFGMVGLGTVYRAYAAEEIIEDDAVAVAHGPARAGYPPCSIALVDIQATIESLVRRKRMPEIVAASMMDAARGLYFAERTWDVLAARISADETAARRLAIDLASSHVQRKRIDAIEAMTFLSGREYGAALRENPGVYPPLTPAYRQARKRAFDGMSGEPGTGLE